MASEIKHPRRCAGCGTYQEKEQLIRVIRDTEGRVLIDETQKRNGRGVYLCRSGRCVAGAKKRRGLERGLKCAVPEALYRELEELTEEGS